MVQLTFTFTYEDYSRYIPKLPIIFVISLLSSHMPSYLHSAYPRAALALIQLTRIVAKDAHSEAEQLVQQVSTIVLLVISRLNVLRIGIL